MITVSFGGRADGQDRWRRWCARVAQRRRGQIEVVTREIGRQCRRKMSLILRAASVVDTGRRIGHDDLAVLSCLSGWPTQLTE
jgi:hypothetical protein